MFDGEEFWALGKGVKRALSPQSCSMAISMLLSLTSAASQTYA
jgi:hypothetical protein